MTNAVAAHNATIDRAFIDSVVAKFVGRPGALLGILQRVQEHDPDHYLPAAALEYVAAKISAPLSQVYSVVTFYALFNLEPQGRNTICICRGTACHTRGSRDLLEAAMMRLGLPAATDGETEALAVTMPNGAATLRTVACFGQCALAPVTEVNHAIHGHMNERTLLKALDALDLGDRQP